MWVRRNKTALTHVSSSFLVILLFFRLSIRPSTFFLKWRIILTGNAPDWHEDLLHHVTPSLMSIVLRPGNHHVICQYKNPFIRRWILYCLLWYSSLWWWKKYLFTCGANVDDHEKKLSFLVSCSFGNTKGMNWSKTAISDYCANVYKQVDDCFGKDTSSIFCHTMGNFNQKKEHLYRMQTSLFRKITVCPCYDNVLLYNNV